MEETTTQEESQQLPRMDFITYLDHLVTNAQVYLGGIRDPETDEVIVNLGLVKGIIDTIEMLEEKTKGNLTAPEANFLANRLYELRMSYVRMISQQEAAAQAETEAEPPTTEPEVDTPDSEPEVDTPENEPEAEAPTDEPENAPDADA